MAIAHNIAARINLRVDIDGRLSNQALGQAAISMARHWVILHHMKRLLFIFATLALVSAACGGSSDPPTAAPDTSAPTAEVVDEATVEEPAHAVVEEPAPETNEEALKSRVWSELAGTQLDGSAFDPGDYAGQDLVLWFWAPW